MLGFFCVLLCIRIIGLLLLWLLLLLLRFRLLLLLRFLLLLQELTQAATLCPRALQLCLGRFELRAQTLRLTHAYLHLGHRYLFSCLQFRL